MAATSTRGRAAGEATSMDPGTATEQRHKNFLLASLSSVYTTVLRGVLPNRDGV